MWAKLGEYIVNKLVLSFLEYLGKYLPVIVADWKRKKQREIDQAAAKTEYDKAASNPELTPEEKAKAYAKYRNS